MTGFGERAPANTAGDARALGIRQVSLLAGMRSALAEGDDLTFADVQHILGGCLRPSRRYASVSTTSAVLDGLIRRCLVRRYGPLYAATASEASAPRSGASRKDNRVG